MIYKEPKRVTKHEMLFLLRSEKIPAICEAMVGLAYHEKDWEWCQNLFIKLIKDLSQNDEILRTAIICIGHIARIHRAINKAAVFEAFSVLREKGKFEGYIEDAISDIDLFVSDES